MRPLRQPRPEASDQAETAGSEARNRNAGRRRAAGAARGAASTRSTRSTRRRGCRRDASIVVAVVGAVQGERVDGHPECVGRPAPTTWAAMTAVDIVEDVAGWRAERRALVQPQQVRGGEHRADGGDDHERAEHAGARDRRRWLYADRMAGNSPQKPARPGRPRLTKAHRPRIHPRRGDRDRAGPQTPTTQRVP